MVDDSRERSRRRQDAAPPRFSVVMPTFNRGYVVWKAISSVLAQTLSSWELLVIDDGSTDNTSRVLEEFMDPRITVHRVSHGGPSRARNRGLELARGELVAYLDSDNWWEPTFLESFDEISSAAPETAAWYCGRISTFWERTPGEPWRIVHDRVEPASILEESDVWMANAPDVNCLVVLR
ncbi:MAG TPA: glycosyltransferase family A protein [Solirubrobacteraceae bacterium]